MSKNELQESAAAGLGGLVDKPKRGRRLSPGLRRAQLLECAITVFARRGLAGAHHAEIAKEGGVAVSTVFVYFPTREKLVSAVLDEVERFLLEMAEQAHDSQVSSAKAFRTHMAVFAESIDARSDLARVWLDWSTAIREDVWPRYLRFQDRMVDILAGTIKQGQGEGIISSAVDPEDSGRLIIGAALMIAQMKFTRQPEHKVEHFMETVLSVVLGLVAPRA